MIESVSFEEVTFAPPPARFEAGTPNAAGAVGLAAALDYLQRLPRAAAAAHERGLLEYARERLASIDGVRLVGSARERAAAVSFVLAGVHPHDLASILDQEGIAVRAGHHCAQPLMQALGVPATARASFALYNTREEVEALADAVERVRGLFA